MTHRITFAGTALPLVSGAVLIYFARHCTRPEFTRRVVELREALGSVVIRDAGGEAVAVLTRGRV